MAAAVQMCPSESMVDEAADALVQQGTQVQDVLKKYAAGGALSTRPKTAIILFEHTTS